MRIIHLTDLHIAEDGVLPFNQDTKAKTIQVLDKISEISCDMLILTGDFCYKTPKLEVYKWLHQTMTRYKPDIPKYYIGGNHDDCKLMARNLDLTDHLIGDELYYSFEYEGTTLIFLDTGKGYMSDVQKQWLQNQLDHLKQDRAHFIFMHHPPMKSGVKYMDEEHALADGDELVVILSRFPMPFYIFSGHYHVEKSIQFHNISSFITPSFFVQLNQEEEDFTVDHYKPAYRIIDLESTGKLLTSVRYLEMD